MRRRSTWVRCGILGRAEEAACGTVVATLAEDFVVIEIEMLTRMRAMERSNRPIPDSFLPTTEAAASLSVGWKADFGRNVNAGYWDGGTNTRPAEGSAAAAPI